MVDVSPSHYSLPESWASICFDRTRAATLVKVSWGDTVVTGKLDASFERDADSVLRSIRETFAEVARPDQQSRRHGAIFALLQFTIDSVLSPIEEMTGAIVQKPAGIAWSGATSNALSLPLGISFERDSWNGGALHVRLPDHCSSPMPCSPDPNRWDLRMHRVVSSDLASAVVEDELVRSAHSTLAGDASSNPRVVHHLIGHRPDLEVFAASLEPVGHLVASTCSSGLHVDGSASTLELVAAGRVRSAVGSLWPVSDERCASFMGVYHRRLVSGLDSAAALRWTQFVHRRCPPDVWAAFVHDGWPF